MVDSEVQWREAQRKQQSSQASGGGVQQASVIPALPVTAHSSATSSGAVVVAVSSTVQTLRKSGYMNSGLETESEASFANKRKQKRGSGQRSKSPKERIPDELKKHLDFHLVDTEGMSEEQLREIPYKKVETNNGTLVKGSKVRYTNSIKSNRSSGTGTLRPGSSQ